MHMGNEIFLNIVLEGTGAGLEEGRIGLSYFNKSFKELLIAYRGIAAMLISSAQYDINARGQGRRPRLAEQMDLEIDAITHHSPAAIRLICTTPKVSVNATNELFAKDVIRRSAIELIDSVDAEARGFPRNKYVRRFLEELPTGTKKQHWQLYEDGKLLRTIDVQSVHLPKVELASAGIVRVEGRVSGIYFPPACEIRITDGDGIHSWFKATEEQIDNGISLRNDLVTAVGVHRHSRLMLLWMRKKELVKRYEPDQLDSYFAKRWSGVLKRLAK
jgi:hypothetical protein